MIQENQEQVKYFQQYQNQPQQIPQQYYQPQQIPQQYYQPQPQYVMNVDNRQELINYPKLWGQLDVWQELPCCGCNMPCLFNCSLYMNMIYAILAIMNFFIFINDREPQQGGNYQDDNDNQANIPFAIFQLLLGIGLVYYTYIGCKNTKESTEKYLRMSKYLMVIAILSEIVRIIAVVASRRLSRSYIPILLISLTLNIIIWIIYVRVIHSYYYLKYFKLKEIQNLNNNMIQVQPQQGIQFVDPYLQQQQGIYQQGIPIQHNQQL